MASALPFGGFGKPDPTSMGAKLFPDEAHLSYHDVRLTNSDVASMKRDWLTDNAIAFWQEYIEREHLPHFRGANIALLRPTIAFLLLRSKDSQSIRGVMPDFRKTTHVFLPINDAEDVELAESGTHWSLLVVSLIDKIAFHYDSLEGTNDRVAFHMADQLARLLNRSLRFVHIHDTPQQNNGNDCGVYVCSIMEKLLFGRLLQRDQNSKVNMSLKGDHIDADAMRRKMVKVVEERRKEGVRRRSSSAAPLRAALRAGTPPRVGSENNDQPVSSRSSSGGGRRSRE